MGKRDRFIEQNQAALSDLMKEPAPSATARAAILARRRMVRTLLEDRRDQLELEALSALS